MVQTAIQLFTTHGFHNAGVDLIIKEAKIPKATFYNYFHSKERLIEMCIAFQKAYSKKKCSCLDISKRIRILELGQNLDQVHNGKLLCSSYGQEGAQLYKIERFDKTSQHTLKKVSPMEIIIWLFHPNVDLIADNLKRLYSDLRDYSLFSTQVDWINYYINRLSPIYQKQSKVDPYMSQSFDIFFKRKMSISLGIF